MTTEEAQVLLPKQLAKQLFDYLSQRPWIEVHNLLQGLITAPQAKVVSDAEPQV